MLDRHCRPRFHCALGLALCLLGGCYDGRASSAQDDAGETDGEDGGGSDSGGVDPDTPDEALDIEPSTAIPRLSRREIDATLEDVFGIVGAAERFLPEDPRTYVNPANGATEEAFDTLSASKDPGTVFVEGLESMAVDVAREFSEDAARVEAIAGCSPAGAFDPACLRALIGNLGLRLWRRPLTEAEIDELLAAATELGEDGGHAIAVRMVTAGLLQSPSFVYKAEIGEDVGAGLRRLDSFELVTRLSFAMWGQGPSAELLQTAATSDIDDAALLALATAAASDARADVQMRTFHQLWLRYDELLVTDPDLAADMLGESQALVDRVLSGGERWSTLLTSTETYVTPTLAQHYGLTAPSQADWVAYGDDGRAGLLSHGSFLSLSSTQGSETLPSRRGSMLAQRILCQSIPPPPPDIDVDDGVDVAEDQCKVDAYAAHRDSGSGCASCHTAIDPLGFGFERYDGLGQYREAEADKPQCTIAGQGEVAGEAFSGPRQFATIVDEQGLAAACSVDKLEQFASRGGQPQDELVQRLVLAFEDSGQDFRALMVALATDPTFRYRREEAAQ